LLARPSNWESDTFAKLLFAISGSVPMYEAAHPFRPQSVGPINFQNAFSKKQEDAKPDLVTMGLLAKPALAANAVSGYLGEQLKARAA